MTEETRERLPMKTILPPRIDSSRPLVHLERAQRALDGRPIPDRRDIEGFRLVLVAWGLVVVGMLLLAAVLGGVL